MKYLLRKCEMFASRTWANFISHRARRDISQYATAYYFTFCVSKTFHLYYHPIVNRKGVTHYTLQGKACEKEYEQIVRTPFVVGRGFISRRFLCIYRLFSAAASHRPTRLRQVKPALSQVPLSGLSFDYM